MKTSNDQIQPTETSTKRGVPRPSDKFPRQDPEIPWEVSSEVLTNHKAKNSGTFRRTMLRSRGRIITCPTISRKPYAVTVGNFVVSRNIDQLCRLLRRLPPRIRAMERALEQFKDVTDYRSLQKRNAIEMSLLDCRKHLTAAQDEASRRLQPAAL